MECTRVLSGKLKGVEKGGLRMTVVVSTVVLSPGIIFALQMDETTSDSNADNVDLIMSRLRPLV